MKRSWGESAPRTLEASSALAAIERERFHSYSSLVRNLHWLASTLVVLYSVLFADADRLVLWSLAGLMMAYTLVLHSQLFARVPVEGRVWIEAVLDLAWITGVILFSGATKSPFFFLYYIVIYSSSPSVSRRQTYAKAGIATLLALNVILLLESRTLDGRGVTAGLVGPPAPAVSWSSVGNLVWPLTGLWLVAYFSAESGTLGVNLHRSLFLAAHTDALTGLPNLRYFTSGANL